MQSAAPSIFQRTMEGLFKQYPMHVAIHILIDVILVTGASDECIVSYRRQNLSATWRPAQDKVFKEAKKLLTSQNLATSAF